jgi:hypothetical protein
MSIAAKVVLAANVLLLALNLMSVVHAQRPPETDSTGTAYLRVNINPTNVPPMVNINPNQSVPRVQVTEMPEVRIAPAGCENRKNFLTGVGRTITGPLMITYLHLPPQTSVTLGDATGGHSMSLGTAGQITAAIFLESGQRLQFDSDIMYSGCRPD